jgi:hypothetical protein
VTITSTFSPYSAFRRAGVPRPTTSYWIFDQSDPAAATIGFQSASQPTTAIATFLPSMSTGAWIGLDSGTAQPKMLMFMLSK